MLLGESHYLGKARSCFAITILKPSAGPRSEVLRDFWASNEGAPYLALDFFGRLHRVLSGENDRYLGQIESAWNAIAYSNYIQTFAGEGAAASIGEGSGAVKRKRHWESGQAALPGILTGLAPDRVLVLGKTDWNHIHYGSWEDEDWLSGGRRRGLWRLPTRNGHYALATWVMHASWGRDSVETFMVLSRSRLAWTTAPGVIDFQSPTQM